MHDKQKPNVEAKGTNYMFLSCQTYSSQSTATSRLMSWVGRPTAVRIKSIVTRPALGILAAPTLARVAVRLDEDRAKQHSITWSKPTSPNHILHNRPCSDTNEREIATPYSYRWRHLFFMTLVLRAAAEEPQSGSSFAHEERFKCDRRDV